MQNKSAAKNEVGKKDDKKYASKVSVRKAGVEPQHSCIVCCSKITERVHVQCDICDGIFYVDCSGIPASVQQSFLQIAESIAVFSVNCRTCRSGSTDNSTPHILR